MPVRAVCPPQGDWLHKRLDTFEPIEFRLLFLVSVQKLWILTNHDCAPRRRSRR